MITCGNGGSVVAGCIKEPMLLTGVSVPLTEEVMYCFGARGNCLEIRKDCNWKGFIDIYFLFLSFLFFYQSFFFPGLFISLSFYLPLFFIPTEAVFFVTLSAALG